MALAHGSILKALAMIVLGLLLGLVGTDIYTGTPRFTIDMPELADGLNFVAVAVGVFGLAEILRNLENEHDRAVTVKRVTGLMPTLADLKAVAAPIVRGDARGDPRHSPGWRAILASFAAYTVEKRLSRTPERFGKGAIEGVAAPEAANNAGAQTSFIPMLTPWHPGQSGDGADDRCTDHSGDHAWTEGRDRGAAAVLGRDRLHVDGEFDAGAPQPAAGRHVGQDADDPLLRAVSGDHRLLVDQASTASTTTASISIRSPHSAFSAMCWSSSAASRRRSCSASCSGRCSRSISGAR